jgi:hypothetical protein
VISFNIDKQFTAVQTLNTELGLRTSQAKPSLPPAWLGLKFSSKPKLLQAKPTFGLSLAWLDDF